MYILGPSRGMGGVPHAARAVDLEVLQRPHHSTPQGQRQRGASQDTMAKDLLSLSPSLSLSLSLSLSHSPPPTQLPPRPGGALTSPLCRVRTTGSPTWACWLGVKGLEFSIQCFKVLLNSKI